MTDKKKKQNKYIFHLKEFWDFLWNSDSWLSWVLNIVLAFVLIKFLLYPGIGFIVGTDLPIVAVISESMEHPLGDNWITQEASCSKGPCTQEAWYIEKGIDIHKINEFSFSSGFNKGDIMFLTGTKPQDVEIGDVIVFSAGKSYPIIHRVVNKTLIDQKYVFETKGDNNKNQIVDAMTNEKYIPEEDVFGVAKARLPYVGYIKIWFTELITSISR